MPYSDLALPDDSAPTFGDANAFGPVDFAPNGGPFRDASASVDPGLLLFFNDTATTESHLYVLDHLGPQAASQADQDAFTDRSLAIGLPAALLERYQAQNPPGPVDLAPPAGALAAYGPPNGLSTDGTWLGGTADDGTGTQSTGTQSTGAQSTGAQSTGAQGAGLDPNLMALSSPNGGGGGGVSPSADSSDLVSAGLPAKPGGGGFMPGPDPSLPLDRQSYLNALQALAMKPPPVAGTAPLAAPNLAQLGLALGAGLLRPRFALQSAAAPFQAQLQRQAFAQAQLNRQADLARQNATERIGAYKTLLDALPDSDDGDHPANRGGGKPKSPKKGAATPAKPVAANGTTDADADADAGGADGGATSMTAPNAVWTDDGTYADQGFANAHPTLDAFRSEHLTTKQNADIDLADDRADAAQTRADAAFVQAQNGRNRPDAPALWAQADQALKDASDAVYGTLDGLDTQKEALGEALKTAQDDLAAAPAGPGRAARQARYAELQNGARELDAAQNDRRGTLLRIARQRAMMASYLPPASS